MAVEKQQVKDPNFFFLFCLFTCLFLLTRFEKKGLLHFVGCTHTDISTLKKFRDRVVGEGRGKEKGEGKGKGKKGRKKIIFFCFPSLSTAIMEK